MALTATVTLKAQEAGGWQWSAEEGLPSQELITCCKRKLDGYRKPGAASVSPSRSPQSLSNVLELNLPSWLLTRIEKDWTRVHQRLSNTGHWEVLPFVGKNSHLWLAVQSHITFISGGGVCQQAK